MSEPGGNAGTADVVAALAGVLSPIGINLIAVAGVVEWDAGTPPAGQRAEELLPGARSVIVVGSGGRALWRAFCEWIAADLPGRFLDEPHPLDRFVATALDRGSERLAVLGLRARRFEPTLAFEPRIDFRRLAEIAGMGSRAPIGMVVHPVYGPWWALRAAWFTDGALTGTPRAALPCAGCPAPCRSAIPEGAEGTLRAAIPAARRACHLDGHRYTDEQLAYHQDAAAARAAIAARHAPGFPSESR